MKRLNVKFLAILLVGSGVSIFGIIKLHGARVGQSAQLVLEKAESAEKKDDLRSAQKSYAEYLSQRPNDAQVRTRAALLAWKITQLPDSTAQEHGQAYKLLEAALREKTQRDNVELRRRLIEFQVKHGISAVLRRQEAGHRTLQEARNNIRILAAAGHTDTTLDFLDAQCAYFTNADNDALAKLYQLVGYDPAKRKFNSKLAKAPDNIEAYILLTTILRDRKERLREADAVVDQMVAANPKSALALQQRVEYRFRCTQLTNISNRELTKLVAAVKSDAQTALALGPNNVNVLLQNATIAELDKDHESARKYLERARSVRPTEERIHWSLARLMIGQQRPKDAQQYLRQGLKELPKSQELLWGLHQLQLNEKDIAGARKTVEQMRAARMPPERVQLAEALALMAEQKWAEAATALEAVRPQLVQFANLVMRTDQSLSRCYAALGQPDRQLDVATSRILVSDPGNIDGLRAKVAALIALGRIREAFEDFEKSLVPAMGREAFLADPALVDSYKRVVTELRRRGDSKAGAFYDIISQQVAEAAPQTIDDELRQVGLRVRNKEYANARALLEKIVQKYPHDVRAPLGMAELIAIEQGPDAGLKRLDELELSLGDSADLRRIRGELIVRRGGPQVKQQLAALERGIDRLPRPAQIDFWTRQGYLFYRLGTASREDVRRCWQRALDLKPGDSKLMEALFDIARETGDNVAMLKVRDEIEKFLGRDSSQWKYTEATRLVVQRGAQDPAALDEALKLADEAAQQRPKWHLLARLQGEIKELKGDPDGAMLDYQRALDQGPPQPWTVGRLVRLQLSRSQLKEARATLQLLSSSGLSMGKQETIWSIELEALQGDPQKALTEIAKAVPESSRDASDFLWKGQWLLRIGQREQGEQALRKAVELGPQLPQTWLCLVDCLVRSQKTAEAERTIRAAENELSEDLATQVFAQCYALLGNREKAEQNFLAALKSHPGNLSLLQKLAVFYLQTQRPDKANEYLKVLIDTASRNVQALPYLTWARRERATLLALTGRYPQFLAAVQLVEANAVSGVLSPPDTLALARLYGSRKDPQSLRQAQRLLEQLQQNGSLDFDDNRLLALVYARTGQWQKARPLLGKLQAERPQDTTVLIDLTTGFLDRGEANEAVPWVRKLEALRPGQPMTIQLSADLAAKRNMPQEAESIIEATLPKEIKADNAGPLASAAVQLERLELYSTAEKKYRQLAAILPDQKLALAAFLARRGRADEAFAILKTEVSPNTLPTVCDLGVIALRAVKDAGKPIPDGYRDQLLGWLEQASRLPPPAGELVIQQAAVFMELLGRRQEAENLYALVIARSNIPDYKAIMSNNLAYLLAIGKKDLPKARALIESAIQVLGPVAELLDTRAMIAIAENNPQEAIKDLTDATDAAPTPENLLHLAMAQQLANNRLAAEEALKRSKQAGLRKEKLSNADAGLLDQLGRWLKP